MNDYMIELEQKIRELLVIDETSPSGLRWNQLAPPKARGKTAGALRRDGYWTVGLKANGEQRKFLAHRLIWFLANGRWPEKLIDHINGNPVDNRLSNLRSASPSENSRNMVISPRNRSGVKGVSIDKTTGKWRAELMRERKIMFLGFFVNLDDAERAIMAVREKLHGGFANHG